MSIDPITIGLILIVLIGAGVVFFAKKRKKSRSKKHEKKTGQGGHQSGPQPTTSNAS